MGGFWVDKHNYSPIVSYRWCLGGGYASRISRLNSIRSMRSRMPSSLVMAKDSSNNDMTVAR